LAPARRLNNSEEIDESVVKKASDGRLKCMSSREQEGVSGKGPFEGIMEKPDRETKSDRAQSTEKSRVRLGQQQSRGRCARPGGEDKTEYATLKMEGGKNIRINSGISQERIVFKKGAGREKLGGGGA